MEYDILSQFINNQQMKDAMIGFMHEFIDKEALKRVYAMEKSESIAEARKFLDSAFEELTHKYGPKQQPTGTENLAR